MPYGICDRCDRSYVLDNERTPLPLCHGCKHPLRLAARQEAMARCRSLQANTGKVTASTTHETPPAGKDRVAPLGPQAQQLLAEAQRLCGEAVSLCLEAQEKRRYWA